MFQFSVLPPLSLYIHIPWCVRKCPYCDFNSHEMKMDTLPERAYIDALLSDLEQDLPRVWGRRVTSIFIGGGTPSLFSPEAIDRLLCGVRARLTINADAEITLEANPGTAEQERFTEYRALGINRLSIGIQSFHNAALQSLGRIHGRREAIAAAEMAHKAGFDHFNLDLMFALPMQTVELAMEDVATAIDLEPDHISYYQLTLEPNTLFYTRPPVLPNEDTAWDIQTEGQDALANEGYQQYETSAYAKEKNQGTNQCRHNINYWQFGDYLGIGAGAHAKITDASQQHIVRLAKVKQPQQFMQTAGTPSSIQSERLITRKEVGLEFVMNALRLNAGFDPAMFATHTGQPISLIESPLQEAEEKGLIERNAKLILPTDLGRRYLNDLLGIFV